jgi:hypothetical protein
MEILYEKEKNTSNIPNDIIYNIYFYTNDYCTASNFWLLSKDFNKNYMTKYNKTYKHKFMLLFNDIFTFLSLLPLKNNTPSDIDFFELITVQIANNGDKKMLRNDIYFIYRVVKNFFMYYLTSDNIDSFYFNILKNISYATMLQGVEFLLDNIDITFDKNHVKIINKYNKDIFLENLINLDNYNENYDKLCLQVKILHSLQNIVN